MLAHYTKLANDESSGNYYAAIQEYGKEGTEITGNLVLASGILTRLPAAAEALNAIKQASYVKVGETLNVIADGVGAREALAALKQAVPGYEFLTADLRKFYGLSENQVAYLRGFAKENKLIITLRSRAEESIKWLNEGAVLKPEQIKIKTVSIDDINYLGYRKGDLGRVVVRRPPSNAELPRSLRAKGIGPQDPEWTTAFKRLKDRTTEYNHPAYDQGYVKYLEDGAKNDELTLRWNLQQNSVDSSVLPNGYTKYGMRLLDEGGGNRVLQFCVDTPPCRAGSPGWRSVTGDVDFLSIMHADGSPLSLSSESPFTGRWPRARSACSTPPPTRGRWSSAAASRSSTSRSRPTSSFAAAPRPSSGPMASPARSPSTRPHASPARPPTGSSGTAATSTSSDCSSAEAPISSDAAVSAEAPKDSADTPSPSLTSGMRRTPTRLAEQPRRWVDRRVPAQRGTDRLLPRQRESDAPRARSAQKCPPHLRASGTPRRRDDPLAATADPNASCCRTGLPTSCLITAAS